MRIGIDLGGTKIEIIAFDDDGRTLDRRRVATPQGDYAATLAAVAGLVEALESGQGRRGTVGVGMPGTLSRASGLVKNANSTCLIGRPLRDDLQRLLGRAVAPDELGRVGDQQRRVGMGGFLAHTRRLAVKKTFFVIAPDKFVENRLVDRAALRLAVVHQRDQCRKERHASNKTFRAVDRV